MVLVLEVAQQALVTWPLAVLAAPLSGDAFRSYVTGLARVQGASALALSALALGAALLVPAAWLDGRPLANGLAMSALLLAQQLQEFCRRVLLSKRPRGALLNDGAGAVLVLAGLVGLRAMAVRSGDPSWLASERVLALSAVAMGAAAAFGWARMGDLRGGPAPPLRTLLSEVWGFGRYILGSRLGEGLLSHAQNFVVASFGGAAATAALEAPRLLLAPVQVAAFGAINFMLTLGAQSLALGGVAALRKQASRAGLFGGAAFAAYAAVFALWPSGWLALVYGGRYSDPVVLWIWCASHVLLGTRVILSSVLYLMRRTELVMKAMLAAGSSALLLSIPLSSALSVRGAALARLAGEVVLLVLTLWLVRRVTVPAREASSS
jgi:O-antigen/teichoic acid export membrane protein